MNHSKQDPSESCRLFSTSDEFLFLSVTLVGLIGTENTWMDNFLNTNEADVCIWVQVKNLFGLL